jgi:hypothetical protein
MVTSALRTRYAKFKSKGENQEKNKRIIPMWRQMFSRQWLWGFFSAATWRGGQWQTVERDALLYASYLPPLHKTEKKKNSDISLQKRNGKNVLWMNTWLAQPIPRFETDAKCPSWNPAPAGAYRKKNTLRDIWGYCSGDYDVYSRLDCDAVPHGGSRHKSNYDIASHNNLQSISPFSILKSVRRTSRTWQLKMRTGES